MALSLPPSGETGEDSYQPLAQINVTPMVDVMLVLLVIFMVAAPLLSVGVSLDLPKSAAAAIAHPKEPIILSLDKEGGIFLGDDRIGAGDLEARLAALAAADPDRIVYVRGDKSVTYATLMDILGLVDRAGLYKVSLVAQADLSKPPVPAR
jgi:biopolymer transport protein ExbD